MTTTHSPSPSFLLPLAQAEAVRAAAAEAVLRVLRAGDDLQFVLEHCTGADRAFGVEAALEALPAPFAQCVVAALAAELMRAPRLPCVVEAQRVLRMGGSAPAVARAALLALSVEAIAERAEQCVWRAWCGQEREVRNAFAEADRALDAARAAEA